jgi:hypothetical protein
VDVLMRRTQKHILGINPRRCQKNTSTSLFGSCSRQSGFDTLTDKRREPIRVKSSVISSQCGTGEHLTAQKLFREEVLRARRDEWLRGIVVTSPAPPSKK